MRQGVLRGYRYFRAGTYLTGKERRTRMYHDLDHGLARERGAQIRAEVERNRLAHRLARATRSSGSRRGKIARGAGLIMALFR